MDALEEEIRRHRLITKINSLICERDRIITGKSHAHHNRSENAIRIENISLQVTALKRTLRETFE